MKNFKLKKLIAVALVAMTIATVSPIGASAAWRQDSNGWWNTEGNSWSTGWRSIDNTWYNFGSDGYMKTGWVNDGGTWYFMQPSGAMKTGWVKDNGTWYYLKSSGAMKTGWVNDGGTWYFMQSSGAMKTGWVNDGGKWYFTAASGAMQTGVVEVDGKVYDLAPSGAMATGNVTINGVTYTFAASGEAIGDKIPTPTLAFTSAGTAVAPTKTTTDTTVESVHHSSGGGGGSSSSSSSSLSDLSAGGTHNGNYTISTTGTFGASDSSKVTTINGDIFIADANASTSDSITLQNLTINGTLTVDFGAGNVILDNVIVNGVNVSNVGSNSLHVRGNSSIKTLTVNDKNNDAHIVVEGNASIANTNILAGAKLEVASSVKNANPFGDVTISPVAAPSASNTVTLAGGIFGNVTVNGAANVVVGAGATLQNIVANSNLVLSGTGTINNVTVNSQGATIDLEATSIGTVLVSSGATGAALIVSSGTTVAILNINAPIAVTGTGTITTANLGVSGITIETKPTNVSVVPGVTATVGGETYNDITPLVSSIYSAKLASSLQNNSTLTNNISVTTGSAIVVTLLNPKLDSLQAVFNDTNQDLSLIEARLAKAEEIMNLHSTMLSVNGVPFKQYLAQADANYLASGGNSSYFNADGSFMISEIAERIKNNTLTYDEFKKDLEDRIIAMCNETNKAPQVSISDGTISETVTKIERDGKSIYDTSLSIDTNINGLVSLGDTTTGTYIVYCGTNYFTVKVTN